jgi:hypothetical protein
MGMVMPVLKQPKPTDPLTSPSHATEHTNLTLAATDLDTRLAQVEQNGLGYETDIEQARLVANTWMVRGALTTGNVNQLIIPLIYNLTDRPVRFEAAMASVLTAPVGAAILVDIVVCSTAPTSALYDLTGPQDTILTSKLSIAAGSTTSAVARTFVGDHAINRWVAAVVTQVGSGTAGSDLTVQLNRLL